MEIILRDHKLPIIKTKRLILRDIQIEDISDDYIAWLNNPEVNKYLEIRFYPQTREKVEEYVRVKLKNIKTSMHFGVYDNNGKRLVGTVTLPDIKWEHLSSDISFVIGHPDAQGKGYATEAVHAVLFYAFKHLGLKKIWAGYYDGNIASAKVLMKNGFKEEGRLKKKLIDFKGDRVDHILVGLLSDDFIPEPQYLGLITK